MRIGEPSGRLVIGSIRITVPRWPFETHAPSGPTATSTASAPIGIRRPVVPATSGFRRVTVPSPALAVHTVPAPTATRSGAEPVWWRSGWSSGWPASIARMRSSLPLATQTVLPSTATSVGRRATESVSGRSPPPSSRSRSTKSAGPTSTAISRAAAAAGNQRGLGSGAVATGVVAVLIGGRAARCRAAGSRGRGR